MKSKLITLTLVALTICGSVHAKKKKKKHKEPQPEPKVKQLVLADLGVSFADSFGVQNLKNIRWGVRDAREPEWYEQLEQRYEQCKPTKIKRAATPVIPKKLHQIWLGSKFPQKYRKWQQSWKEHHPDWDYKLWTDADVASMTLKNQAAYDASTNYGQKSDILRYEILDQFGGLYVDTDCECVMPFDALVHRYSFFTGLTSGVGCFEAGCALIASAPGHPIVQALVENLSIEPVYEYVVTNVAATTGPGYFTKQIMTLEPDMGPDTIVFPCNYFYPLPFNKRVDMKREQYLQPETFAIHHWGHSWVGKDHYPKGACVCGDCWAKRKADNARLKEEADARMEELEGE